MEQPIVNNFKIINTTPKKPPYLEKFGVILEYQVYSSSFNINFYVVFDHENNLYYIFENQGSDNIEKDLGWCIKTYIIKS